MYCLLILMPILTWATGDGDCCGAAILNIRFEEHVRRKIGAATFDDIRRRKPRTWGTALTFFEDYLKKNFDPDDTNAKFFVPFTVNDGEAPGVYDGYLEISHAEVSAIFDTVINSTVRLIESQMHRLEASGKSIRGIVLVGGLGQSACLFKKLEDKFAYLNPPPPYPGMQAGEETFQVMQPNHAWTAVVRGGVLRGLEGDEIVVSRVSRRHYGVRVREPFNAREHTKSCKVWDRFDEIWRADNRMTWYIKKGQVCESEEPVLFCKSAEADGA